MPSLIVEDVPPDALTPCPSNARTHGLSQVDQIAASITARTFTNPILVKANLEIICGHGRWQAAKKLGLATVPIIRLGHLTEKQIRALRIADNKVALNAGWDTQILAQELELIVQDEVDLDSIGFTVTEADQYSVSAEEADPEPKPEPGDDIPPVGDGPAVTQPGDIWILGRHRLACGDCRDLDLLDRLMAGVAAAAMFTDGPYNVKIEGNVSGQGGVNHPEFAMGSGEMTRPVYTEFLRASLGAAAAHCRDGALVFSCIDWRHVGEMEEAGRAVFSELKNICVWAKTNAGMGTLYRSQHELIFLFKVGTAPHQNNFGLGGGGRHRSNLWTYPGVNSFRKGRLEELRSHPTVKPLNLVKDAILDVTRRGEVVIDRSVDRAPRSSLPRCAAARGAWWRSRRHTATSPSAAGRSSLASQPFAKVTA